MLEDNWVVRVRRRRLGEELDNGELLLMRQCRVSAAGTAAFLVSDTGTAADGTDDGDEEEEDNDVWADDIKSTGSAASLTLESDQERNILDNSVIRV